MQALYNMLPIRADVVPFTKLSRLNTVLPMMTAARPKTICPVPMVAENALCSWQTMQPESATKLLAITRPRIFMLPLSLASAVTSTALLPVARSSRPLLVFRYQSRRAFPMMASRALRMSFRIIRFVPLSTAMVGAAVKIVSKLRSTGRLEPAIWRLMENSAVMVMIPASRSRTCSRTWIRPVASPAIAPQAMAARSAR